MFHSRRSTASLAFTADDLLVAGLREIGAGGRPAFSDGLRVTPVLTIMIDAETAHALSTALADFTETTRIEGGRPLMLGRGVASEPTRDERLVLALVSGCQCRDRRVLRACIYHLTGGMAEARLIDIAETIALQLRAVGLRLCPVALSMVDALAARPAENAA